VPEIDTQDRRDQAQGQHALQQHLRASGLINLAASAIDARYDSAADARAVRDRLAAALAALADGAPDLSIELSTALKDVAASLIEHLSQVAGTLADVTTFYPPDTLPIEVIAWDLYGDSERSDEILARNPTIFHPTFVTGKVPLEVKTA
jgi:prophage DNA circulation protein